MNKTVRIVLYVLSILMVVGVIAAFVVSGRDSVQKTATGEADTEKISENIGDENTEETPEWAGEEKNTEAGNGQAMGEETEQDSDTTILFAGDVLFANAFKAGYDASGIHGVVSEELLQQLKDADILMVNHEFPLSDRGTQMENKQFTFRCSPSYVKALQEMGVDIVSLANNHTLDFGKEALSDTFSTLDEAGIRYAGAGDSVERAQELQVFEVNGKKFGFLAVSRVIPEASWKVENSTPGIFHCYDDSRLVELVEQAKEQCDFLAVYPHWGIEYQEYPENYQTEIAEKCIRAGADVIVGSHTHCLQGVSYIEGKPVFYSLGNFIFGQNIDRSAMVKMTVDASGNVSFQFIPVYAAQGVTQLPDSSASERICQYLDGISTGATVAPDGTVTE